MSKENQEVLGAELENDATTADAQGTATETATDAKPKREKKVLTPEQTVAVANAVEVVKGIDGISEEFAKFSAVLPQWTDVEANKAIKVEVVKEFGGAEKLKAYLTDEEGGLTADLAILEGFKNLFTNIGAAKSSMSRISEPKPKKGGKKITVSFDGKVYKVSADYALEIQALPSAEKKALFLAHPSIETVEVAEIL